MLMPLVLLAIGAIFSGYLFKELFISESSINFWKNSIFFIELKPHDHLPLWLLLLTPLLVTIVIPVVFYMYIKDRSFIEGLRKTNEPIYNFLINKWYFDELYDFLFVKSLKKIGRFFWKSGDQNTIDKFGPDGFAKVVKYFSDKSVKFQSGYIYDYAFVMLIGLSLLISFIMIY